PAAEAYLEHRRLYLLLDEEAQRGERAELEIGELRRSPGRLDRGESAREVVIGRLAAAHAHALVVAHEMRRGVAAGPVARVVKHRLEHGANRPLAVRAADRDHREGWMEPEGARHALNARKAERDRLRVQPPDIGEPVCERSGFRAHCTDLLRDRYGVTTMTDGR